MHELKRRGWVEPDDLAASLRDYVVVDIRDRVGWEGGHIPGSDHVPVDRIRGEWRRADMRLPVAVLGEADEDAEAVARLLVERGGDAVIVRGGVKAWRDAGQCLVTNRA
jgi:rhodanese-related sulfurtransferase